MLPMIPFVWVQWGIDYAGDGCVALGAFYRGVGVRFAFVGCGPLVRGFPLVYCNKGGFGKRVYCGNKSLEGCSFGVCGMHTVL